MSPSRPRGFTLIELIIVLSILGLFATIAIPRLSVFFARAKQSEVKNNLKHYFALNRAYFVEHGTYFCRSPDGQASQCGFVPPTPNRYAYSLNGRLLPAQKDLPATEACRPKGGRAGDLRGFIAIGTANIDRDLTCDVWSINQDNQLRAQSDDLDS